MCIPSHHHQPPLREVLRDDHLGIYFPAPPLTGDHRQATTLTIRPSPPLGGPRPRGRLYVVENRGISDWFSMRAMRSSARSATKCERRRASSTVSDDIAIERSTSRTGERATELGHSEAAKRLCVDCLSSNMFMMLTECYCK